MLGQGTTPSEQAEERAHPQEAEDAEGREGTQLAAPGIAQSAEFPEV